MQSSDKLSGKNDFLFQYPSNSRSFNKHVEKMDHLSSINVPSKSKDLSSPHQNRGDSDKYFAEIFDIVEGQIPTNIPSNNSQAKLLDNSKEGLTDSKDILLKKRENQPRQSSNFFRRTKQAQSLAFGGGVLRLTKEPVFQIEQQNLPEKNPQNISYIQGIIGHLYHQDYLRIAHPPLQKQPWNSVSMEVLQRPIKESESSYIKARRINFINKNNATVLSHSHSLNVKLVCKFVKSTRQIFFREFKITELRDNKKNGQNKCNSIEVDQELDVAPSLEYDPVENRIYGFDNKTHSILVYSAANKQLLSEIKTLRKRYNPILYLYSIYNRRFLTLIGGYQKINTNKIEGCKLLEFYQIEKWSMSIKSRYISCNIGRISPLVLQKQIEGSLALVLIGGNSTGQIRRADIDFDNEINKSTNQRGVAIFVNHISDCINDRERVFLNDNIHVKTPIPFSVHSGCTVIPGDLLFLPKMKQIFQIRIIKDQIGITSTKEKHSLKKTQEAYFNNQYASIDKPFKIFKISDEGYFEPFLICNEKQSGSFWGDFCSCLSFSKKQ